MLLNPLIDIDMFKLSSFCKLILCSSCTLVCLKIVVWVKHAPLCNMNPAVYLKWVLTNHPHVSSWSETSLSVAVAGTIPFFISLWCQQLLMAAFDTLEGGIACHCLFLFFLGEFLLSICAISVNWLWFDCRVLLSVENLDRWCIELRWLIRKRTVDVLLCDCLHNILCFYSRPKLHSTFLDSYLRSTQYWAVFFFKSALPAGVNGQTSAYEEMNHIAFSSWLHLLKFTLAISVCALKDGDLLIFSAAGSIWEKREQ